jgi:hypothetical protein
MKTTFITHTSAFDSGGACPVDFVHLPDGSLLGITDDCVVLYASMEDFLDGDATDRPIIRFN